AQRRVAARCLARKQRPRVRLVDDADAGGALAIGRIERASREEADPHQTEVVLADDAQVRDRPLWQRQNRTSADAVRRARVEARERQANRDRGIGDARLRTQPLDHLRKELSLLRVRRVSAVWDADKRARGAFRLESWMRPLELQEAHEQQAASDEKDDRQCDFGDDEGRAEAAAALAGGSAPAVLQRVDDVRA